MLKVNQQQQPAVNLSHVSFSTTIRRYIYIHSNILMHKQFKLDCTNVRACNIILYIVIYVYAEPKRRGDEFR